MYFERVRNPIDKTPSPFLKDPLVELSFAPINSPVLAIVRSEGRCPNELLVRWKFARWNGRSQPREGWRRGRRRHGERKDRRRNSVGKRKRDKSHRVGNRVSFWPREANGEERKR